MCCSALVLIVAAILIAFSLVDRAVQQREDLGNKPPGQVFTRIFHASVPPGVFNLKVAGMASVSGEVWMRFQTDNLNAVLNSMKRNSVVPIAGLTADPNSLPTSKEITQDHYTSAVGWKNALRIKKPEYYQFATNPLGTGWFGILIVDRTQNIVYVHGDLF